MLATTQKEFEKQCEAELCIPYCNGGYIQLSKNPRRIGHSFHPRGIYGPMCVSHATKLKGFTKVLLFSLTM
jgi:hypothetical protein